MPKSRILLDVKVKAVSGKEWATDIYVTGFYDGPNDIVANRDYELKWTADSGRLLEAGAVTLLLSSGKKIRQVWSSIITPEGADGAKSLSRFAKLGQVVTASVSPFAINGNKMSYQWEGVAKRLRKA